MICDWFAYRWIGAIVQKCRWRALRFRNTDIFMIKNDNLIVYCKIKHKKS